MWTRHMVSEERGVVAPIVGVMLVVLLGFAAFAIDLGYVMVTKNELQNIADAAAQAGSRALGRGEGTGSIIAKVQEVASENYAAGKFIEKVIEEDIVIGKWDNMMVPPLAPTNTNPNAVKVTVRRDTKANGPISTFFAGVLKISTVDVWASATALCELLVQPVPAGGVPVGGVRLPVGIGTQAASCGTSITLSTNTTDNARWTTFDQPAQANLLLPFLNGTRQSPVLQDGGTVNLVANNAIGLTKTLAALATLTAGTQSTVVVYDGSPSSGPVRIVGLANVTITRVVTGVSPSVTVLVTSSNPKALLVQ